MTIELTISNFAEYSYQEKLLVVFFWAEWDGQCKVVSPIFEQLSVNYKGRIIIGKVDTDSQSELAERYGIRSIPTILFFRYEEVLDKQENDFRRSILEDKIDKFISL